MGSGCVTHCSSNLWDLWYSSFEPLGFLLCNDDFLVNYHFTGAPDGLSISYPLLRTSLYSITGTVLFWYNHMNCWLTDRKLLCRRADCGTVFNNVEGKVFCPLFHISFQNTTLPASCWFILCTRGKYYAKNKKDYSCLRGIQLRYWSAAKNFWLFLFLTLSTVSILSVSVVYTEFSKVSGGQLCYAYFSLTDIF